MTLKRVSIVIDFGLWDDDDLEKQINAVIQGLHNAKGWGGKYPNIITDYEVRQ